MERDDIIADLSVRLDKMTDRCQVAEARMELVGDVLYDVRMDDSDRVTLAQMVVDRFRMELAARRGGCAA